MHEVAPVSSWYLPAAHAVQLVISPRLGPCSWGWYRPMVQSAHECGASRYEPGGQRSCVGSGVGNGVGSKVGSDVGSGVGPETGTPVGIGVGVGTGNFVGAGIGTLVGAGIGTFVGAGIGTLVGDGTGTGVASTALAVSHTSHVTRAKSLRLMVALKAVFHTRGVLVAAARGAAQSLKLACPTHHQ